MSNTSVGLLQDYMTPAELAAELGVNPRTLERWNNQRVGPPRVRLGRKVLYRRDSVVEWITASETNSLRSQSRKQPR